MSTYREIGILITLASLLERGEIAKAEGKGALHLPKGTRGAITLVTMLAVFMLTVGSGLPYFGHTRYRTFIFDWLCARRLLPEPKTR